MVVFISICFIFQIQRCGIGKDSLYNYYLFLVIEGLWRPFFCSLQQFSFLIVPVENMNEIQN